MTDTLIAASRRMIAEGSRSFAVASRLLAPHTRDGATLLYAWCRHCDDRIDDQDLGRGSPARSTESDRARLAALRAETQRALAGEPTVSVPFQALQRVVECHSIPHHHPMELIDGFAMDVEGRRYVDIEETLDYGYHVAGVVGVMMAHIMGVHDRNALLRAADLGIALQLTNIARDVVDDASAGRIYLPSRWLEEAGVPLSGIAEPRHRTALAGVVARLLGTADRYYASGAIGVRRLQLRSAWAVSTARIIYRDIGRVVVARGDRAWDRRAVVRGGRKLYLVVRGACEALSAVSLGRLAGDTPREGLWTRS